MKLSDALNMCECATFIQLHSSSEVGKSLLCAKEKLLNPSFPPLHYGLCSCMPCHMHAHKNGPVLAKSWTVAGCHCHGSTKVTETGSDLGY